jgi:hypothetical protein
MSMIARSLARMRASWSSFFFVTPSFSSRMSSPKWLSGPFRR